MPVDVNLRNRAWLLGLVRVANWAGLQPVKNQHVHALVFLANSLAPVYEDVGVETRVIKHTHGPFYPDAQWDLDRMVGQELLAVSRDVGPAPTDGWTQHVAYEVTRSGIELVQRCRESVLMERSYRFLLELAAAFATLTQDERNTAPLQDAIYSLPGRANGSGLVFENAEDNFSLLTASAFDELVGNELSLSPKDRVHLYLRYLAESTKAGEEQA